MVPVASSMQTNAKSQLDINILTVRVIDGMVANNLDWFGANQVNTPSIPFPHLRIMIHTTTVS